MYTEVLFYISLSDVYQQKKEALRRLSQSAVRRKLHEDRIAKRSRIGRTASAGHELSQLLKTIKTTEDTEPTSSIIKQSSYEDGKDAGVSGPEMGSFSETSKQIQPTDLFGISPQTGIKPPGFGSFLGTNAAKQAAGQTSSGLQYPFPTTLSTFAVTSGFPVTTQSFSGLHGTQSQLKENTGFPVSGNQGNSGFGFPVLTSPLSSGLPVKSSSKTSVFPVSTSSMTTGFPLSNTLVTSGLPVSTSSMTSVFSVPSVKAEFGSQVLSKDNSNIVSLLIIIFQQTYMLL